MATIDTAKEKYINKMKTAYEKDHYAQGVADFFGVSKDKVADSAPVKNWKAKFADDDKRKARADKWQANLLAAFGLA